ncbi:MAG TPA: hypothetical protein VJ912_03115 [Candidatus Nanoarchaeia archaeon]|nr:hypothetical protein [Candidatus Nanoarchaeia archaeon]
MKEKNIKFINLDDKINEVIDNKAEFRYLEFVFGVFNSDLPKEDYEVCFLNFVDSYFDLYNHLKKEYNNYEEDSERKARFDALYEKTKSIGY